MKHEQFSKKQLQVLCWWHPRNRKSCCDAVICDGAVRSGKTFCLSLSFVLWSFAQFKQQQFALCGKTIGSLQRNVMIPLMAFLEPLGYRCNLIRSQNLLEIRLGRQKHRYYLFGGKDEGSAAMIQGMTLAGVLFDEVALMPRSFVEQALARCSVEGSRYWFCCNPEHPAHWFYQEWIRKNKKKKAFHLHFLMEDNPSLSKAVRGRYENLYSGVFYQRYIEGKWVQAHGAVYPMFTQNHIVKTLPQDFCRYVIACDYGTTNPSSFGLWGYSKGQGCWYRIREYYHCSRTTGVTKTDEDYCDALEKLAGDLPVEAVVVDPSAASFIQALRVREKYSVLPAENRVLDGIRLVSSCLVQQRIKFYAGCKEILREFSLYRWNLNSGKDLPIPENDHAMDEMRYFAQYAFAQKKDGFYAVTAKRG